MKFFFSKNSLSPLLGHLVQFFSLIKKIFFQPLVEIIFNIINILDFLDPSPYNKKEENGNITYGVFWKIFKNLDFGFQIFEKGQILRPFGGTLKTKLYIYFLYSFGSNLHKEYYRSVALFKKVTALAPQKD